MTVEDIENMFDGNISIICRVDACLIQGGTFKRRKVAGNCHHDNSMFSVEIEIIITTPYTYYLVPWLHSEQMLIKSPADQGPGHVYTGPDLYYLTCTSCHMLQHCGHSSLSWSISSLSMLFLSLLIVT